MTKKITNSFIAAFLLLSSIGTALFAADMSVTADPDSQNAAVESKSNSGAKPKPASSAGEFVRQLKAVLNTGNIQEALALFENMPDSLKADSSLNKLKISLLISAARFDEASAEIASLQEAFPDDVEVLEMKMMLGKASGNKSAKRAAITAILEKDPKNAAANIELGQEKVLAHKYNDARTYYLKALSKEPKNLDALFGLGQTSYYTDRLEDARNTFKKMISIDPNSAIAYFYLGKLSAETQKYSQAVENVQKAISISPDSSDFYLDLGTYYKNMGKTSETEQAWTKAIELEPNYFLGYAYRAGLYDELGEVDKALEDYRSVVRVNPKYYYAYESIGILAWHKGLWSESRKAFEKAYNFYMEEYKGNIARYQAQAQQYQAIAQKSVDPNGRKPKKVDLTPDASYPLMIAACYVKENQYPMAKMYLEKVLKSYPDTSTIKYNMVRLFKDFGPVNAEMIVAKAIQDEENLTLKGEMLYYYALYFELKKNENLAQKYYAEVVNTKRPMFFEYRLAEWKLGITDGELN